MCIKIYQQDTASEAVETQNGASLQPPTAWRRTLIFQDFAEQEKYLFGPGIDDDGEFFNRPGVQVARVQGQYNGIDGAGCHAVFWVQRHGTLAAGVHLPNHKSFATFNAELENGLDGIARVAGAKMDGIAL